MNLYVTDPEWGWWIVFYFFLGGIAAGAYFTATLLDLFAEARHGDLARLGYLLALPLLSLCGLLLILDLSQPLRFWHMLFRSEVVHEALAPGGSWARLAAAPLFKPWSPMSIGSWALSLFGVCSGITFLGSIHREGRLPRLLRHSGGARVVQLVGCGVGFFVAAYTGALLTATNQPVWSQSVLVAALFLASAAATGLAALYLLGHWRGVAADSLHRLADADRRAVALELVVFLLFLGSLAGWLGVLWSTTHGKWLLLGVPLLALLGPLLLHGLPAHRPAWPVAAAGLSLVGGFLLRYTILATPRELLERGPELVAATAKAPEPTLGDPRPRLLPGFSPEDGRPTGGGPGGDGNNRPADPSRLEPRSKVWTEETGGEAP